MRGGLIVATAAVFLRMTWALMSEEGGKPLLCAPFLIAGGVRFCIAQLKIFEKLR